MPTASPFLSTQLDRWHDHRKQVRKNILDSLDGLLAHRQQLDDTRRQLRQDRLIETNVLETEDRVGEARWVERLRRIEEWKTQVSGLQEEARQQAFLIKGFIGFSKAQRIAPRLARRFEQQAERLFGFEESLQTQLSDWGPVLAERQTDLTAYKERERHHGPPFYVSRGRKRPELDFLKEQAGLETELLSTLQGLRRLVNQTLDRLHDTSKGFETLAQRHPTLFETSFQLLREQLKTMQERYSVLRDKLLSDGLMFESHRRSLQWIRKTIEGMKVLEDAYRRQPPWYEKLWKRATT